MERSRDEHPTGAAALSLRALRALWPEPVCPDCADWQVVEIITFDHALLMRDIPHEWHGAADFCCQPLSRAAEPAAAA